MVFSPDTLVLISSRRFVISWGLFASNTHTRSSNYTLPMPSGNDPTRILKSPASPRKGTPASAWKKMKTTVSSISIHPQSSNTSSLVSSTDSQERIIEFGSNGELFIAYKHTIEVWDWVPSPADSSNPNIDKAGGTLFLVASKRISPKVTKSPTPSVASLNVNSSHANFGNGGDSNHDFQIASVKPLNCYRAYGYYVVVICIKQHGDHYFQLHSMGQGPLIEEPLVLPPSSLGGFPYTFKNTTEFFIIGSNEGCVSIFNKKNNQIMGNMNIQCKVFDGKPLVDVSGRWLAYVPSNTKEIVSSFKKLQKKKKVKKKGPDVYESKEEDLELDVTPLKLPVSGPLLDRLLKSLSSTAIDGALKLSELGANKVKSYLGQTAADEFPENSKNVKESVLNFINSGNRSLKRDLASSQFIVILDLNTEQPVAVFSPPGGTNGISNLSLSPYDTHLATVNARGDSVYVWDLARMPTEISLVAKHSRGRTPSSIDQILWNTGDSAIGIITRTSGSLHWFANYVNSYWILSGLKASKLSLGPKLAQLATTVIPRPLHESLVASCILSIDQTLGTLVVVSPNDGSVAWKYSIPTKPISLLPEYLSSSTVEEIKSHKSLIDIQSHAFEDSSKFFHAQDPLSRIELETSDLLASTSPLYQSRAVQFGTYNFKQWKARGSFRHEEDLYITMEPLDSTGVYKGCKPVTTTKTPIDTPVSGKKKPISRRGSSKRGTPSPGPAATPPPISEEVNNLTNDDPNLFRKNYEVFARGFTVDVFQFGRGTGLPVFSGSMQNDSGVFEDSSEETEENSEKLGVENLRHAMENMLVKEVDVQQRQEDSVVTIC
ncbi:hypothetical protein DASC09_009040 [Saccharomycopsis crataegensis]|uniref:Uncharacterized protein n=1 Tax=Saccharomycopsis crataegensis TaxID=43959 RepID=A0AAV5QFR6_9ASCO|nr:hypothetical protein DASC09_009040 [Saccharomycopsis crataegensis]